MIRRLCLVIASLTIPHAHAQQAKAFDVASIKPHDPADPAGRADLLPGGRVAFHNLTMRFVFEFAYSVRQYQTSGEPSWFDERYDIDALAQGEGEMTDAEVKPYLRALLEDRLKLVTHRETKDVQVYDLVVAPGGSKLKPSTEDEKPSFQRPSANKVVMVKIPLTSLANFLSSNADILRSVTDKTGLAGDFDFTLAWTPESARGDASNPGRDGPSIFTSVQEQLGLKLVAKKGPDQVLVIDHIERTSAN
jgi:uncharacterized protein (TIGR03435 family)